MLAAAPPTAWEQVKHVPKDTWISLGICIVAVVAVWRTWKALKKINELFPYIAGFLAAFLIFFYWVYERNEPRFLTPIVDKLAPFFPSKDKQGEIEQKRKRVRDV